ncbi:MFS general substrate transporter [Athelia psychrophila]|uniref:MFS general substrate transporter n=1 Tax=Athelia psychrophila TaxID=1759441 RepID=A0A166SUI7_9AGAM|nr:MFS general substrate transporter [Fibularhizoctonia sp. CBS 109695]
MSPHASPYNDSQVPHDDSTVLLCTLTSNSDSTDMNTTPLRNHAEVDMEDQEHDNHSEIVSRATLRWWKRPNLAWILVLKALSSTASAITAGPKVEIYTELACRVYRPEYLEQYTLPSSTTGHGLFSPLPSDRASLSILSLSFSPVDAYLRRHQQVYFVARDAETHTKPEGNGTTNQCASDPQVQAAVAKLSAAIAVVSGVFSCLVTGWWGGFLDRNGRTRMMGINIFGPLSTDFIVLFVFLFSARLPGGYWFLIIAPIIEGAVGGASASLAAESSYVHDVTEPHKRARNYSMLMGLFYAGGAIGPTLGGLLADRGSVISPFYGATLLHIIYGCLVWFFVPESTTRRAMADSRYRYEEELKNANTERDVNEHLFVRFSKAFWYSVPLGIFMPRPIPGPAGTSSTGKRDWNMTYLAISVGLVNIVVGSVSSIYQYALYIFGWSSLKLGYYISISGLSSFVFLTTILPLAIKLLTQILPGKPTSLRASHFDYNVARVSTIIIAIAYALMALAPTGLLFTLSTVMSTFGQGYLPAAQCVASLLHSRSGEDEAGRLFGALGVVYVLGGRIIGPAICGALYAATVGFWPSAILWVSTGCLVTAFLFLSLVRLPSESGEHIGEDVEGQDDLEPESERLLAHRPADEESVLLLA